MNFCLTCILGSSNYLVKTGFPVTFICWSKRGSPEVRSNSVTSGRVFDAASHVLSHGCEVDLFLSCIFKFGLRIKHNLENNYCKVCSEKSVQVYPCRKQCERKSGAKCGCSQFVHLRDSRAKGCSYQF